MFQAVKEEALVISEKVEPSEIKLEHLYDIHESGAKWRYSIVEVFIYFGWPIALVWILGSLLPKLGTIWLLAIGIIVFLWPKLKGMIGLLIAKVKGIRDPRHTIRSSSFWFDGFIFVGSPVLREIRKYSAFSRSLDIIYNMFGHFGIKPQKFTNDGWVKITPFRWINYLIKGWTFFWIGMPVAQDVRSRLDIIAEEYRKAINQLSSERSGRTIKMLEVAGGQLQAVIMGISRAIGDRAKFNYQVVSIEPEIDFAKPRAIELVRYFGLNEKCFTFIPSAISTKDRDRYIVSLLSSNGMKMADFDIVVCVGLGDYYYTPKRVINLLEHLDGGYSHKIITANISDNFIERWFLHTLIQWPKMRYRSLMEWKKILMAAFGSLGSLNIKIIQTPHKIFNIAVVE